MRFKHLYIILPFLWAATGSMAQSNQPNLNQTGPSGTNGDTWATPAEVNTTGDISYIRSFAPLVPITDTADVNTTNLPGLIKQQTAYLDGFMQPFQTVTRNAANVNGQARHLINVAYNYPTQDQQSYLPYASGSSGLQSNAFQAQRSYYSNNYYWEGYTSFTKRENTTDAYNRSTKSMLPGKSQLGQGRGTITKTLSNNANEIIIWDMDNNGIPVASGYYAASQLLGVEKIAPIGTGSNVTAPQSRSYKDKDGRLILKMIAAGNTSGTINYEYTYYVYDTKGNLRCTITPKAFKYYQDNSTLAAGDVVKNLCFQYRYDDKGRLIAFQKPGEDGFTYLVYDPKNRGVMRQTPNEAMENKWEITYYDAQNRIKATSIYAGDNPFTREDWQNSLDDAAINGTSVNTIPYYLATTIGETIYPDDNNGYNHIMSYTYYDDYSITDPDGSVWSNLSNQLNFTEMLSSPGAEIPETSKRVYGLPTGSKMRILAGPNADASKTGEWRQTVLYYDDKGRAIYTGTKDISNNAPIHENINGIQYDFANRILINKHLLTNYNADPSAQSHVELNKYTYDAISGALVNTKHKVDDGAWNTLNTFTYDDMGRVKRKSLGNGAEVQDMSYNIRGQLTGINGTYAETGLKENYSRSFGEAIRYDYGFAKPRYDGKTAGMIWRGSNAAQVLAYGYDYKQNQLLQSADFNYYTGVLWNKTVMDYSVSGLNYDENGNLTDMNQRGTKTGTGPVDMDKLHYDYEDNSNRLSAVTDNGGVQDYGAGDFQDNNAGSSDYVYDLNGNLINDANKGISTDIGYTFFNKPVNILLGNGNTLTYSYDVTGNKVQELLVDNSGQPSPTITSTTTDYIGNFVYEDDELKYILTGEGRTVYNAGASAPFKEEYFVKDHLGNVRSTISAEGFAPHTYLAQYEIASANLENLMFDNIDELREYKPGGDESNSMAARLNGSKSSTTVGSALLLHVMAGDKIDMKAYDYYDYYNSNMDTPVNAETMIANVITTLTGGYNGVTGENHDTRLVNDVFSEGNSSAYNDILAMQTDPSKPKAYLNYVVFDENMNLVPEASGAFQAQHEGGWGLIGTTEAMEMPVNGYIAVYLSNATLRDVFFDGLQVQLIKGKLLEETHYYPHGLPIKNLSSSDMRNLQEQRRRYQGNEYIRDGLDWMSFGARQYDPQIGRFLSVDPLAAFGGQDRVSPYAAMGNMPEMMVDPNGLQRGSPVLERAQAITPDNSGGFATDMNWVLWGVRGGGNDGAGATYGGGGGGGGFDTWAGLNALVGQAQAKSDRIKAWNNIIGQAEANGGYWSADGSTQSAGGGAQVQTGFTRDQVVDAGATLDGETDDYYVGHYYVDVGLKTMHRVNARYLKAKSANGQDGGEEGVSLLDGMQKATDGITLSADLTINGSIGTQKLANALSGTSYGIINLSEYAIVKGVTVEMAGRTLGAASLAYNTVKFINNPTVGRGIEAAVSAVSLVPGWGWVVGAIYFAADVGWTATHDGKSIAQSIDGE